MDELGIEEIESVLKKKEKETDWVADISTVFRLLAFALYKRQLIGVLLSTILATCATYYSAGRKVGSRSAKMGR